MAKVESTVKRVMARDEFPYEWDVIENEWITMSDGCRLSARVWHPKTDKPVPTIFETQPYRKRDGMRGRDIEDGTTDLAIIDVAMYNAYQKEYNYDVVANQISDEDAKAIADNSYAYYIFPKDQEELRDKVDEQLKELKKDGTLSKLSQKYFGQDTAPEDDQFEKTPN